MRMSALTCLKRVSPVPLNLPCSATSAGPRQLPHAQSARKTTLCPPISQRCAASLQWPGATRRSDRQHTYRQTTHKHASKPAQTLSRYPADSFRSHNLSRHVARHSLQLIRRLGPVEVPIRDRGTVLNDFQGESVQSVNAGTQMPEHWPSVHLVSLSFNTGDTGYRPRLYSSVLICERRRPGASTGAFAPRCRDSLARPPV